MSLVHLARSRWVSAAYVDENAAVYAVPVARLGTKEARCSEPTAYIVLGSNRDEPIVGAEAPAAVEPLDAAADIACEKCLGLVDPEACLIKYSQATHAARHVW